MLGLDVQDQGVRVRERIGIVPEVESPPSYLTAYEFLLLRGPRSGRSMTLTGGIDRWLRFFDLEETKGTLCKDLSKGMRQKVMLSAAFIHEPRATVPGRTVRQSRSDLPAQATRVPAAAEGSRVAPSSCAPTSWRSPRSCARR